MIYNYITMEQTHLIANSTGALKIATETSGIAITLGHTTSEVTVADNMTVTGRSNSNGGTANFGDFKYYKCWKYRPRHVSQMMVLISL